MQIPHDPTNSTGHTQPPFEIAAASWLRFAAAPVFGLLAGLALANPDPGGVCGTMTTTGALEHMGLMYLLMGIVHLPPWLTLVGSRIEREARNAKEI